MFEHVTQISALALCILINVGNYFTKPLLIFVCVHEAKLISQSSVSSNTSDWNGVTSISK